MLIFDSIFYKNFLSFGDQFTEIKLSKSPTTLITGTNGAGKSALLDALTFVLYGKPFRKITKPQMVNSINGKKTIVEVLFKTGTRHFLVRRGIKPNVFEIYESDSYDEIDSQDNMIEQPAKVADYQVLLEKNILKMNYDAFTQVVILGKATYVPFMRLDGPKRRQVIEDLLGLRIFGVMNAVLKDKIKFLKTDISEVESSVDMLIDKIDNRQRVIDEMNMVRETRLDEINTEIESNEKSVVEIDAKIVKLNSAAGKLVSKTEGKAELVKKKRKMESMESKLDAKFDSIQGTIDFFTENDDCPTCGQGIDSSFKETHIKSSNDKLDKLRVGLDKIYNDIEEVQVAIEGINEINDEINKINREISGLGAERREKISQTKKLKAQLQKIESVSMEAEEEIVAELQRELDAVRAKRAEYQETHAYYLNIASMLKDDGIKTLIINKYLPMFNSLINQFLTKMGFMVKFTLDDQFNEHILSRYRDKFSYNNFSEGQKLRIDLAILMTWREIAKIKNCLSTNLLIMDEIFDSSLDQTGVDAFVDLLPAIGDSNVFVISHTPDKLYDKFRSHINFTLDQNFSIIE